MALKKDLIDISLSTPLYFNKEKGILERIGPDKGGRWEIVEK